MARGVVVSMTFLLRGALKSCYISHNLRLLSLYLLWCFVWYWFSSFFFIHFFSMHLFSSFLEIYYLIAIWGSTFFREMVSVCSGVPLLILLLSCLYQFIDLSCHFCTYRCWMNKSNSKWSLYWSSIKLVKKKDSTTR